MSIIVVASTSYGFIEWFLEKRFFLTVLLVTARPCPEQAMWEWDADLANPSQARVTALPCSPTCRATPSPAPDPLTPALRGHSPPETKGRGQLLGGSLHCECSHPALGSDHSPGHGMSRSVFSEEDSGAPRSRVALRGRHTVSSRTRNLTWSPGQLGHHLPSPPPPRCG